MTFDQHRDWCRACGKVGCSCPYCHGAKFLRLNGVSIRCDACNAAPEPEAPTLPTVASRRKSYAERQLDL